MRSRRGDASDAQEPAVVLATLERELSDLERQCAEHRQTADAETREATEWERRAMAAIREGRDVVARQALTRLTEYVTAAAAASDEAAALEGVCEAYRNALAAVRATVGGEAPPA
jgi:phage shock protein A